MSTSGASSLELSPTGIPASLRPFFQDYEFEASRPDTDAFTVIERALAWGNRRELRWLFKYYTRDQVVGFVRDAGWWRLPPHRFYFWLNVLCITDYRKSDYSRQWLH